MSVTGRLSELDSLRGLAALTVALGHFWGAFYTEPESSTLAHVASPAYFLSVYLGHNAVILFFLLSGFVLSIPRIGGARQSYPVFVTRRVFRIYLPYLAALALATIGDLWLHGRIPLSDWAKEDWGNPWSQAVDWHLIAQHVMFLGFYDYTQINGAFWSLIVEMRISLLFPLLCALILFLKPTRAILLAICGSVAAVYLSLYLPCDQGVSVDTTLHFMGFFVLGILLAKYREPMGLWVKSWRRGVAPALLVVAILVYIYGAFFTSMVIAERFPHAVDVTTDWVTGIAASSFIVLGLNYEPLRKFLLLTPCRFLGKISYSVYLVHTPVSFALLYFFYEKVSIWLILILFVACTIGLSTFFYYFVEKPSMEWGRSLSNHFKKAEPA